MVDEKQTPQQIHAHWKPEQEKNNNNKKASIFKAEKKSHKPFRILGL